MAFGGEPLLYPEIVCAIHKEAMNVGIPVRDVITNGFWSTKTDQIQEIAKRLAESGVNEATISVDCFHQEFIPLEIVKKAAESLVKAGTVHVSWDPCWVISKDHDNSYNRETKTILEQLRDLPVEEDEGNNVQPEGRAILWLKDYLPSKTMTPKGKCGDLPYTEKLDSVKTICVEPDGRIAVCNEFYIGNASKTDIIDIVENYDPFKMPEAKAIIENGMEGLVNWARTKGVEPDPEGYYNICHMCTDIRKRASKA
jgi:MoaA/NifB/PqqE/SkfB family radical SAM enzyme